MAAGNLFTGTNTDRTIQTGLSTQILIAVDGEPVGAVQELTPSQTRNIKRLPEVGTDGFIEGVPNQPTTVDLRIRRVLFEQKHLPEAFSRAFVNIASQRVPFDILVFEKDEANLTDPLTGTPSDLQNDGGVITHAYRECWFQSMSTTYSADDYVVMQNADVRALYVVTYARGVVGKHEGNPNADSIEALADANRRGSLDAAGLSLVTGPSNNIGTV